MLTKFLKKDFLRTDRPALKMIGGRKNLQHDTHVTPVCCCCQTVKSGAGQSAGCTELIGKQWMSVCSKLAYVKKFPGLNVSMSCSVSSPRNSVAASKPRPMAKPSPQAVIPSPTKESLQL